MTFQSRFLSAVHPARRRARALVVLLTGTAFLAACASASPASTKRKRTPVDPGDDFFADDVPSLEEGLMPTNNEDSGAFGASSRPAVVGLHDGGAPSIDAGPVVKEYCAGALAPGDLQIDELLIASRAGSLDDGEWVEIKSTRTCWLKLKGLTIESPRGTFSPNRATIAEDFELAPKGSFVVADSADPAKNHALPGKVFAWNASDVLKNDGDTVSLKLGDTVIDSLTYPSFTNLEPGRTLAFPDDCASPVRGDWARWSLSFDGWAPGQKGTPNATNGDVACY